MQRFLEKILSTLYPQLRYRIVPHDGKSDLKKSIPQKVKVHCKDGAMVIVLIDQDNSDCLDLKSNLIELCRATGETNFKVRIVCHELESWYLGDLNAVDAAFGTKIAKLQNKNKFRNPDNLGNAKQELQRLIRQRGQLYIAEQLGSVMTMQGMKDNKSHSFQVFLKTLFASNL